MERVAALELEVGAKTEENVSLKSKLAMIQTEMEESQVN